MEIPRRVKVNQSALSNLLLSGALWKPRHIFFSLLLNHRLLAVHNHLSEESPLFFNLLGFEDQRLRLGLLLLFALGLILRPLNHLLSYHRHNFDLGGGLQIRVASQLVDISQRKHF